MLKPYCQTSSSVPVATKLAGGISCVSSVEDIPADTWARLAGEGADRDRRYWYALEQATTTNTGDFRYVLLPDEQGETVAIAAFQYVHFDVEQVLEHLSRFRWLARSLVKVLTRPRHRLLVGGSVWISGSYGRWGENEAVERYSLHRAADYLMEQDADIYAVLLKDFAEPVPSEDYYQFEVDPIMRMDLRPFDTEKTYRQALRSKYRQRLRSAEKKSREVVAWELDEEAIEMRGPELMALFYQVVQQDVFCLSLPPAQYISTLKQALGDDFLVTGYFLEDRLVGFRASLLGPDQVHAYMVGFSQEYNQPLKLYQRMLYDYVREAISLGSESLDLGRTALEIKSCVGAKAEPHYLYIRFRYRWLHRLLRPVFDRLGPGKWQPRHPFSA